MPSSLRSCGSGPEAPDVREGFQDLLHSGNGEAVSHKVPFLSKAHPVGKAETLGEVQQPCDFLRRKSSHPALTSQIGPCMHVRPAVSRRETGRVGLRVARVEDAKPSPEFRKDVSGEMQFPRDMALIKSVQVIVEGVKPCIDNEYRRVKRPAGSHEVVSRAAHGHTELRRAEHALLDLESPV